MNDYALNFRDADLLFFFVICLKFKNSDAYNAFHSRIILAANP